LITDDEMQAPAQPPPAQTTTQQAKGAPPPPTEFDDEAESKRADEDDARILGDPNNLLSHAGDKNFLVRPPPPRTQYLNGYLQNDPDWRSLEQKQALLRKYGPGMTNAERTHREVELDKRRNEIITQANRSYGDEVKAWRDEESQQHKLMAGRTLAGSQLREAVGDADGARLKIGTDIEASAKPGKDMSGKPVEAIGPEQTAFDKLVSAATNPDVMDPETFNQLVVDGQRMNPGKSAIIMARMLNQAMLPRGSKAPYNGRNGSAGANYRLKGYDVDHNRFIELPDGRRLTVSRDMLRDMDYARRKAYAFAVRYKDERRKAKEEPPKKAGWQGWLEEIYKAGHPERTPTGTPTGTPVGPTTAPAQQTTSP
jgi:hypothetical protein